MSSSSQSPAALRLARTREEERFVALLEKHQIPHLYEPCIIAMRLSETDGRISEGLNPDFYLPAWDLHVEISSGKKNTMLRKRRKHRKLMRLYPYVRITVLMRKDIRSLEEMDFSEFKAYLCGDYDTSNIQPNPYRQQVLNPPTDFHQAQELLKEFKDTGKAPKYELKDHYRRELLKLGYDVRSVKGSPLVQAHLSKELQRQAESFTLPGKTSGY